MHSPKRFFFFLQNSAIFVTLGILTGLYNLHMYSVHVLLKFEAQKRKRSAVYENLECPISCVRV